MNKREKTFNSFFPKNRKGQYYLVAAIIIIGIFSILISTVNYSKKKSSTIIYELSDEIAIESSKVLEYFSNTGENKIENFARNYSNYVGNEIKIYFITGNRETQKVYKYVNNTEQEISFDFSVENILTTEIEGNPYSFYFEKGENLYSVMIQETDGEKYILKN